MCDSPRAMGAARVRPELLVDIFLVALSGVVAFLLSRGRRTGLTPVAAFVGVAVPICLVAYSQWLWANTGYGLIDRLTCVGFPTAQSCRPDANISEASGIAADAIWHPSNEQDQLIRNCVQLSDLNEGCLVTAMSVAGASPSAIDAARAMGGQAYLVAFYEFGHVDLGSSFAPHRANTNDSYVFLNGSPPAIGFEELLDPASLEQDDAFRMLQQRYPEARIWYNARFVKHVDMPHSGQRFVFRVPVTNQCRACELLATADVGVDFTSDGRFVRASLVEMRPPDAWFDPNFLE